jgi:N,N'-diacetyllegionaminate synthase
MGKILIIAEAGINHNGKISYAKKLIEIAAKAGADIIKFQTFKTKNIVLKNVQKTNYQKLNQKQNKTQYEMLSKVELKYSYHNSLLQHCKKNKIEFLSTGFDLDSIDFLSSLKLKRFKIPSGEITNYPYLKRIANLKKPTILSTGMASKSEIKQALSILLQNGLKKKLITILHCTSEYPAPYKDLNLRFMQQIKKDFNIQVGYSDHSLGIEIPIAASALGACIIEKHITLNKNLDGPDQKCSIEFEDLKKMVDSIRNVEIALGTNKKIISANEKDTKKLVRKFIVAKTNIVKGTTFTDENLTVKRSGSGINAIFWNKIIGKKAKKNFKIDEIIKK